MSISLIALRALYRKNPKSFEDRFSGPWLLWHTPAEPKKGEYVPQVTIGIAPLSNPKIRTPLAWEVKKAPESTDGMSVVTVGRSAGSDIHIDQRGVSRMHAFFFLDQKTKSWKVADASSRNGTFVGDKRVPNASSLEVVDRSIVKFGTATVQFLLQQTFLAQLDEELPQAFEHHD